MLELNIYLNFANNLLILKNKRNSLKTIDTKLKN